MGRKIAEEHFLPADLICKKLTAFYKGCMRTAVPWMNEPVWNDPGRPDADNHPNCPVTVTARRGVRTALN
jgi:hypothetical protein